MERDVVEDESAWGEQGKGQVKGVKVKADGTWTKREERVLGNRRGMVKQGNGGVMVEAWWNKGKEG